MGDLRIPVQDIFFGGGGCSFFQVSGSVSPRLLWKVSIS